MPEEVLREEDDVQKLRQARAEQQAAMMQAQQQQEMMQSILGNAGKLSEKPQEGSFMNDLNSQLLGGLGNGSV